jgi:hypothetical protein
MRPLLPAWVVFFALISSSALADCGDPVTLKKTTTEDLASGIIVSRDTVILRPAPDGWNALLLRQVVGSEIDVCVTVTIRIEGDPQSSAGGVQFWRSGQGVGDDFYAFQIDSGGNAAIARSEDGKWHSIVKWGRSKLLKKGINASNELRLTTTGDTAKLYINGKLFKTVDREPGGKGGFGTAVMAEAGKKGVTQVDFTNVRSSTQSADTAKQEPQKDAAPVVPSDASSKTGPESPEMVPALDAEGKRIYDLLLTVPPLPGNVAFAKTKFLKATGNPSPKANSDHGSAEVTYSFEPPVGGTENRISFFIYPDAAAAADYMPDPKSPFKMIRDMPMGSIYNRTYDADAPFNEPVRFAFGYQTLERIAWTRWIHQDGRVVMIGFTDETLPPLKEEGTTTDKISDETLDRGLYLLEIAKFQLDAIKGMTISTETTPAPGALGPLDPEAKSVFDYLLMATPDAGNLDNLGTAFLETTSSAEPKPAHGQAEIVYHLKPPADGLETSLSFFFYPDELSAARYLDLAEGYAFSVLADLPDGKVGRATVDPFGPFDQPIAVLDGAVPGEQRGWARLLYRQGRMVIVALVGEKTSGADGYKASEQALRQGALLLAIGKLKLDAAEGARVAPAGDVPMPSGGTNDAPPPGSGKVEVPAGAGATTKAP